MANWEFLACFLFEIFVEISVFCIKFYSSSAVLPSSLLVAHNSKFIFICISYLWHLLYGYVWPGLLSLFWDISLGLSLVLCYLVSNAVSTNQIYQLLSVAFSKLCCFLPQFENPVEQMYTDSVPYFCFLKWFLYIGIV